MPEVRWTTPSFLVLGIIDQLGEASPYDVKVEAARTVAPFRSMPPAPTADRGPVRRHPADRDTGARVPAASEGEGR
ncbi:hypothetical protein [Streptomyces sp. NPDC126503]|uniref:hypothetical protein n=1 Tax=Streptomyces sp. NPDC126503 TaxID=3155315 RepID=UPI00331D6FAF